MYIVLGIRVYCAHLPRLPRPLPLPPLPPPPPPRPPLRDFPADPRDEAASLVFLLRFPTGGDDGAAPERIPMGMLQTDHLVVNAMLIQS